MDLDCSHYGIRLKNETVFQDINETCSWINLILAVPTALVNASLIIALLMSSDRTKPCQLLLLNLAATDFLAGFANMPIQFVVFRFISLNKDPCNFANVTTPVGYVLGIASFITVSMIAVERYISIFHPFFHLSKLSSEKTAISVVILWVVSISVVIPSAASADDTILYSCVIFLVVVGTVVNIYCYFRILLRARKVRRQIQSEAARFGQQQSSERDKSLLRVGSLIVISMTICYTPIATNSLANLAGLKSEGIDYALCWAWTLAMVNSLINPIITCSFSPPIRRKIAKMWTCKLEYRVTEESWTAPSANRVVQVKSASQKQSQSSPS